MKAGRCSHVAKQQQASSKGSGDLQTDPGTFFFVVVIHTAAPGIRFPETKCFLILAEIVRDETV
jgi:hypothetical protein